jgi:hypothetical protein
MTLNVTQGEGSKKCRKSITYYLNGPLNIKPNHQTIERIIFVPEREGIRTSKIEMITSSK